MTTLGESSRVHDDTPPPGDQDAPPDDNVRTLPNHAPAPHLEAERALLGAFLYNPGLATRHLDDVNPDDYDEPRHQAIHEAIQAVQAQGLEPDPIAVNKHLRDTHPKTYRRLFDNGVYLFQLFEAGRSGNPNQIGFYAGLIREAAAHRRIATELKFATMALDQARPETWHQALGYVMDRVDAALNFAPTGGAGNLHTDLSWLLDGQPPVVEPPAYVRRSDGNALFYPGRVNGIFGDPESAKTWIAQTGLVEALAAGQRAAIIDVDHNGQILTTERLLLLGATKDQLADPDLFRYCEPTDGPELLATISQLAAWKPAYVVHDSIGEMMPMLGAKSVDNDELTGALRALTHPLVNVGTCVVTVDHLPKSQDARTSGYAIGGTAKKRAVDGAYIEAIAKVSPAPNAIGKITLLVKKDRPGRLRSTCTGQYVGTFILDSTNPMLGAVTSIASEVPRNADGKFRPTGVMEQVSRFIEDHDMCSVNEISEHVTARKDTVKTAIERLIEEGFVSAHPAANRRTNHHSIALYREAEDDQL